MTEQEKFQKRQLRALSRRTNSHDYYRLNSKGLLKKLHNGNKARYFFYLVASILLCAATALVSLFMFFYETRFVAVITDFLAPYLPFLSKWTAKLDGNAELRINYGAFFLLFAVNFLGAVAHTGRPRKLYEDDQYNQYYPQIEHSKALMGLYLVLLATIVVGSFVYEAITFYNSDFLACLKSVTEPQLIWLDMMVLALCTNVFLCVSDTEYFADLMQAEHEKQIVKAMDQANGDMIPEFVNVTVYNPAFENYTEATIIDLIILLFIPSPSLKISVLLWLIPLIKAIINVVYHLKRQNKILLKVERGRIRKYQGEYYKHYYDYTQGQDPRLGDPRWGNYWYNYEHDLSTEQFRKHLDTPQYYADTNLFYEHYGDIHDKEDRALKKRRKQQKKYDIW